MLNQYFILHLSLIDGVGPVAIQKIVSIMRSDVQASDLYSFSAHDWMRCCGVTQAAAYKIVAGLSDKKLFEAELRLIQEHAINWVTIIDDEYPALLRQIYMPPTVLYWQGGVFDDAQKHIAIVGARASNAYGHRALMHIVPDLVQAGVCIVSGGALGIDARAHETTVDCGGKTIVVLGSGLLKPYPLSNKNLFKKIIENNGLVVSSFPLLADPVPGNFPARNRIISGLSHGCLVVQAAQKSGSLITAHYALEQGRDVFAIPGAIDDPLSAGCHGLIQSGATLVMSAADIVQECRGNNGDVIVRDIQTTLHSAQQLVKKEAAAKKSEKVMDKYSDVQKKIMNACNNPASLDDIIQATGLSMDVIQSELFNLQLDGNVSQDFIGMWVVIRW